METFVYYTDGLLILFYRITGHPVTDYFIGSFILAFLCVIIGDITISSAIRFNKSYIDDLSRDIREKEKLSIEAYNAGDNAGYKALNKQATEAWGKQFFTMAAYSAGILWPLAFALGWMQSRFYDVDFLLAFPLSLIFGKSVSYIFTFIPIYILCRILFKYMRPCLPYFKGVHNTLNTQHHQ